MYERDNMSQENMISQKLRVVLAERSIKASQLSIDTGIAKSTLTKITSGRSKTIHFETIEKICRYLKIEPRELFTPCENTSNYV